MCKQLDSYKELSDEYVASLGNPSIQTVDALKEYVRMHGPEHHVLDGAALLTAYYNAGGNIDLQASLTELMNRALSMPGAMCGMWGVCGAVTSLGAALSIIENTGPLSKEDWGKHMKVTSKALNRLAEILRRKNRRFY